MIRELTTEDSLHIGLSYYMYILSIISFRDCYSVIASVLRFVFFFYSDLIRLSNGFDYLVFVNFAFYFQGQIKVSFIHSSSPKICLCNCRSLKTPFMIYRNVSKSRQSLVTFLTNIDIRSLCWKIYNPSLCFTKNRMRSTTGEDRFNALMLLH